MKKFFCLFAVLAFTVLSCTKEDVAPVGSIQRTDGNKAVFHATTEDSEPGTKVFADENLTVLWNEDDRISVFNRRTLNDQYMFMGEDGDNGGDFEEIPANDPVSWTALDHIYAVYPFSPDNSINTTGTQITVNLPAEQTYKEHSFGIGANTMVAVTDGSFLPFKNVCGYLKFRFYGDNIKVKSIKLEGNNGEKIAGKAHIYADYEELPTVSMDNSASSSITINCSEPISLGSSSTDYTEFIFVIPPITFTNGFKVCVVDELGRFFEKSSTKSLAIKRNRLESMGVMRVSPTYVQFEDANFKAYCIDNFDIDGDGEISFDESIMIKRIDVRTDENHNDISSLKGIESFTNLTYLNCSGSGTESATAGKLSTINLAKNENLDTLYCDFNKLASLDISNLTNLKYLHCANNQLLSLDISQNPLLEILYCSSNLLTSLDISSNTLLTGLTCSSNQLTSLDINHNIALKTLFCNNNQLTTLDLSSNTVLTQLACSSNQLAVLDLRNNTLLTYLACGFNQFADLNLSNNANLTNISCQYNQLTDLDLSHNTALTKLSCNNNQLTSLDVSNTALGDLYAWPQNGTNPWPQSEILKTIIKKKGQSINYYRNYSTIDPSANGIAIVEVE